MNGDGRISWTKLTDFLNDSDAPPGYVCFIDSNPAIQIDLFEDFYTLFWLGSTDVETFISVFVQSIDEVQSEKLIRLRRSWFAPIPSFEGFASVVIDSREPSISLEYPQKKARYYKKSQAIRSFDTRSVDRLKDRLYTFVEPNISRTVSIHCELKATHRHGDYQFALWTDTEESSKGNKETGISSNLPITESLEVLLSQTSPAVKLLRRSEFDALMRDIRGSIFADGRYY